MSLTTPVTSVPVTRSIPLSSFHYRGDNLFQVCAGLPMQDAVHSAHMSVATARDLIEDVAVSAAADRALHAKMVAALTLLEMAAAALESVEGASA